MLRIFIVNGNPACVCVCACFLSFFLLCENVDVQNFMSEEKRKFSHAHSQGRMQFFGLPRQTQSSDNNKVNNKVNYENKHSDSLISSSELCDEKRHSWLLYRMNPLMRLRATSNGKDDYLVVIISKVREVIYTIYCTGLTNISGCLLSLMIDNCLF